MEHLQPDSFINFIGSALLLLSCVLAFLSLIPKLNTASLRLFAILALAGLSLFSNHWTTYFAAIFIIATAVTELEFLHVLAAIIRGDKNYFDFRREYLTKEEAIQKSSESIEAAETEEELELETQRTNRDDGVEIQIPENIRELPHSQLSRLSFQIETKALAWAEKREGTPIQKYVRFSSDDSRVEFDGFVDGKKRTNDTIYEVKWVREERQMFPFLMHFTPRLVEMYHRYTTITKRKAELVLVIVTPEPFEANERAIARMNARFKESGVKHRMLTVTYEDIGIETQKAQQDSGGNG